MTQEQKQLLLVDLCARLPYETRVRYTFAFAGAVCINEYSDEGTLFYDKLQDFSLPNVGYEKRRVVCILPYLRPMSSITEEEKEEYDDLLMSVNDGCENTDYMPYSCMKYVDWLNSNHFDYRDLIPMGLALEAPEDMYK